MPLKSMDYMSFMLWFYTYTNRKTAYLISPPLLPHTGSVFKIWTQLSTTTRSRLLQKFPRSVNWWQKPKWVFCETLISYGLSAFGTLLLLLSFNPLAFNLKTWLKICLHEQHLQMITTFLLSNTLQFLTTSAPQTRQNRADITNFSTNT